MDPESILKECNLLRVVRCLWPYHVIPTWCFWWTLGQDWWVLRRSSTHWLEFPVVLKQRREVFFHHVFHLHWWSTVGQIPDQKDRSWHHQKRRHFSLCPAPCPSVPWVISADSSGRRACPRQFLWQQSPGASFRPLARPPRHHRGRSRGTDLSAFLSCFRSHHRRIPYQLGEELVQVEGGQGTGGRVSLWIKERGKDIR